MSMLRSLISAILICVVLGGCSENTSNMSLLPSPGASKVNVPSMKPRALMILEQSLHSENGLVRNNAIEIVAETNQKQFMSRVVELLKDPSVPVRFGAAVAIGDMQCFGCKQDVGALLNDDDENVKIAAAYALVKLGDSKFHNVLVKATDSKDQTVRANAVLLIGKIGDKNDVDLLYKVMAYADSLDKVRIQAVESIARLGDEDIYRSKLWALQISKYADDRVMGIRGMGALGSRDSVNAIETMLQDDVPEVRLAAAEQLGRLGIKHGEDEVFEYFQTNPNLDIADMANGMAVMAIGRLNSPRLNVNLPEALESKSPFIRLLGAQSVLFITK